MQLKLKKADVKEVKDELLAIAVAQGEPLPFPHLTKDILEKSFEGKAGQFYITDTQGKASFRKLLLYGLGEKKTLILDNLRRFGGAAYRMAAASRCPSFTISAINECFAPEDAVQAVAEGILLADYKPTKFKTKKEDFFDVPEATVISKTDASDALDRAVILAGAQNYVRDIDENPANIATPQRLEEEARKLAKCNNLSATVLGKDELKKLKMNAILAVNQGSALAPVFVMLEYNRNRKDLPLYAIVGKGITFDSGGISLKPSKGMQEMKYDKTGAVCVLGIMKAASELKLPLRLLGAFAATENLPSGTAQKPGDIITAYNGKTIEVLNTDAEGRLTLADSLAYISERKPDAMIDLATLTGAMITCLGHNRIGLFSNDDALAKVISDSGESVFERVWRFPMDSEYKEMNKGDFADIKNQGSETGEASSITAACFLGEFVNDCKWAHLDIAGVDNMTEKHPYLTKGASGIGVRLVTESLSRLAKNEKKK
jgi:leucyl aminopeptidase